MNLGQKTIAALKARTRAGHAPFVHEEVSDGIHLAFEIQDSDKYGVLLRRLTVRREGAVAQGMLKALLQAQAAEAESRFTYLLESFKLIELDETAGSAQIRSGAPYREADTLHYYEILLRGGTSLSFARHQKQGKNGEREIEPSYVTEQVLARLCDDGAAVVLAGT